MPEAEFELYLNMLSRLMRLTPEQRAAISDELRDHLEVRLAELVAAGHSREEAVRLALEDCGDAAGLAADFRAVTTRKQKRKLMVGSVAALVAGLFIVSAFWPIAREMAPPRSVAENGKSAPLETKTATVPVTLSPEKAAAKAEAVKQAQKEREARQKALAAKVQSRAERGAKLLATARPLEPDHNLVQFKDRLELFSSVDIDDVSLRDALKYLGVCAGVDFVFDPRVYQTHTRDEEFILDAAVQLKIVNSKVSIRTILDLMLEQIRAEELGYLIEGEVVQIVCSNNVQVYDCRDLLAIAPPPTAEALAPARGPTGKRDSGGGYGPVIPRASTNGQRLIEVIENAVEPDSWHSSGGNSTITEFNGLVTIKQSGRAHRSIRNLLKLLRNPSEGAVAKKTS